jgi:chlorite dismutase
MDIASKITEYPAQQSHPKQAPTAPGIKRQFVNFAFYKVDPAWRRLSREERERGKVEFEGVVKNWKDRVMVVSYTLVGIRGDCDLMLWRITEQLENFPRMTAQLLQTGLGKWLSTPYSYLAMTRRSMYVDKHEHEGQDGRRLRIVPGQAKYLFVYPFIKTNDWYQLPQKDRQRMMDVHIAVGHKYPTVKINTTYSFGLDDQEFVVAFESDYPEHFLDLVMEMREHEVRKYTLRDTPIFTCARGTMGEVLASLG